MTATNRLIAFFAWLVIAPAAFAAGCPGTRTDCPSINANRGAFATVDVAGDITPQSIGLTLYCAYYASLQACYAALPSTGGRMVLAPDTTYTLSAQWNIAKPNVNIECPSWNTVIKRDAVLTAELIYMHGAGDRIFNCTIDGNGGVNVTNANSELDVAGASSIADHVQVINARTIAVTVDAPNARITNSTITGMGTDANSYGIWAIAHYTVTIDNNIITNTGIDAIGFDGIGSKVIGNRISNHHCYTGVGGGGIVAYTGGANNVANAVIANNTIDAGCAGNSSGMELSGSNLLIVGNTVLNQKFLGIILEDGAGFTVTGNVIRNSGTVNPSPGLLVNASVSSVQITSNRIVDDQGTHTQTYGVQVQTGASNSYLIANNLFAGNLTAPIFDGGTGLNKTISGNVGVDDVVPVVATAAAFPMPLNPVVATTGATTMTSVSGSKWTGRQVRMLPGSGFAITAGNNIGNSKTVSAGVPVSAIYDGTLWWFQ